MRRRTLLLLGVGLLVGAVGVVAADMAQEEARRKHRAKYRRAWRVVSLEVDGNRAADQDARKLTVINQAGGTWVVTAEGREIWEGSSTTDPRRRPKAIDFVPTEGGNAGRTFLGIYDIDGDTRRLCFAQPGQGRPAEFSSGPGSGHVLVVFRREK
jgi:uncharacterized protein (TIGR03067 family)